MKKRFLLVLSVVCLLGGRADAQLRQVLHTTLPADSVLTIRMDLTDSFTVRTWNNSSIFIESEVVMAVCQEGIFKFVTDAGRYGLVGTMTWPELVIRQSVPRRSPLNSPKGACDEQIRHTIYVPSEFTEARPGEWSRPENLNRSTINNE